MRQSAVLVLFSLNAVVLGACEGEPAEPSATDRAIEELQARYEALADRPGEAADWAAEDIENIGDWEYRIVELDNASAEAVQAELNELGNERWEAYWIEPSRGGIRVYLKRPSISYLSRLPLSQLTRLLTGGGG